MLFVSMRQCLDLRRLTGVLVLPRMVSLVQDLRSLNQFVDTLYSTNTHSTSCTTRVWYETMLLLLNSAVFSLTDWSAGVRRYKL